VNSNHLSHIVQQPDLITGQQALELEELCRKFPAFSTPFVLLAKYYHQTGDYRAAEAIQKAALRVHDRSWLADFVTTPKETQFPIPEITSDAALDDSSNTTSLDIENVYDTEQENLAEPPTFEAESSETHDEAQDALTTQVTPDYSEENNSEAIALEADKPKEEIQEPLTVSELFVPQDPDEWVFDEIETLEAGNEATWLGFSTSKKQEFDNPATLVSEDQSFGAGGIIQPDIEEDASALHSPETDMLQITESIIISATPYQIEQFFPSIQNAPTGEPTDFYSWLSNPVVKEEEKTQEKTQKENSENHRIQQQSIIDRFIETNPGVIRPKKEFFTPETAAKKSEHLPENLATETLAKVYLQQGNFQGAIRIYERLMLKFPEKNAYFANLIQQIQKDNNP
jgi:tetratricopeptide (TPR) repeat protein